MQAEDSKGQNLHKDTYMFAERDTCNLYLDHYKPAHDSETMFNGKEKPTIIFMFGGGFKNGERDEPFYNKWFKQLTDNGFNVVSIDYRLGLKGSTSVGIAQVNAIDAAIHIAVEDLFSATKFIIENAEKLDIDPNNMMISGSSAGAITVMQAEYELCNRTSWAEVLPEDFRYVGVMSFSGAILSREGLLDYKTPPCPTLMLHGTADKLVNYGQIRFFNLGFFGSDKIAKRFKKLGFHYNIWRFLDYGHEIAGSMDKTLDIQMKFIENNVMNGKYLFIDSFIDDPAIQKGVGSQSRKELYGKKK